MKFWDASALIPLLVPEQASERMKLIRRSTDYIFIWWASPLEMVSGIARLEREKKSLDFGLLYSQVEEICETARIIPVSDEILTVAKGLLRAHPLRAADAQQLAAAIVASENQPSTLPFVCLDDRLIEAAQKEGFQILI